MEIYEANQFQFQAHTNAVQSSTEALVCALNRAHAFLWGLPDDQLADLLNRTPPAKLSALMTGHNTLATAANIALTAAESPLRAKAVAGREISNDGTAWSVTPIQPADPAPQPEE
jgi:hypothetical protein